MDDPFFVVVLVSVLVVAVILLIGIGGFAKGGRFNRKYSNKLMRLRIVAQLIAVVLIAIYVWTRGFGG
ncbi:twin transmembrane helix small protein [Pontibaca salina]|uniref:Twin transmembrane helix small protein n=1 Tax=Pontibaca salina TaxID=2795731 RepID=A0A934HLR3_9RHOB|nr:twin transmembrane helix small protein [Pontibaca salina]MBI6629221.1 twin transmembrane helix small protein [Pontibaca salina]